MKRIIAILSLAVSGIAAHAQTRTDYDETVNRFQTLYNNNQNESIFNMFSERIQTLMSLDKTRQAMDQLHAQAGNITGYKFEKEDANASFYNVAFANSNMTLAIALNKDKKMETFRFLPSAAPQAADDKDSKSAYNYQSKRGDIMGTLAMPDTKEKVPVVLIIAGSGPIDRNGNQGPSIKTDAYKMLADSLRKAGIASVRYDKRGIGASAAAGTNESSLTFEDMVQDAVGFVKMLKSDSRFSSVYILGHSEGSLVGILAAEKEPVHGFISVAGVGNSADKIIVHQISAQSEEMGLKAAFVVDSIKKGKEIADPGPDLSAMFRPSVLPYMRSWFKYTPTDEIARLRIPTLILQGTTDIQVSTDEAHMLKDAATNGTLVLVKGMNHVLKDAPEDRTKNIATYSNPKLPLKSEVVTAITGFVKKNP